MKLVLYQLPPTWPAAVSAAFPGITIAVAADEDAATQAVSDAEAFCGWMTPTIWRSARRLRWIQAPLAGLENYFFPDLVESDVAVTNMRGIYSDHIADHVMAFVLCFARGFHVYFRQQVAGTWDNQRVVPIVHLGKATLLVVGLGGIGREVARRARGCDMRVRAVDPRAGPIPGVVDEVVPPERLREALGHADFVAICAPQTSSSTHMMSGTEFGSMRRTAYFINIGRGKNVDLAALVDAVRSGTIAGAGLDVFEQEPLPSDSPLWSMENVLLTPHVAGLAAHGDDRRLGVLLDNLGRFIAGEPLSTLVDKRQWF